MHRSVDTQWAAMEGVSTHSAMHSRGGTVWQRHAAARHIHTACQSTMKYLNDHLAGTQDRDAALAVAPQLASVERPNADGDRNLRPAHTRTHARVEFM
jgi:hypothetical protein